MDIEGQYKVILALYCKIGSPAYMIDRLEEANLVNPVCVREGQSTGL